MTDPVAETISQLADTITSAAPGSAVVAPSTGSGVTSVDVDALAAQISALQARLDQADKDAVKAAGNPLADTARTLKHFLAGHGDPVAVALGDDLAAAIDAADTSGDTTSVARIADRLDRHLARNGPYPGENYHYTNARSFTSDLPELIDSFRPTGQPASAPANVVAGSVVG